MLNGSVRMAALGAALALAAVPCAAQPSLDWPRRSITLQAGGMVTDYYDDATAPMGALRADWRLRNWLRSEVGASYARAESGTQGAVNVAGVAVAIQAELPTNLVRPYVGLGMGIHGTFEPEGGDRYFGPSNQAMAGLRVRLTDRVGLRGELRYRMDAGQSGGYADNMEMTGGLSWRF